MLDLENKDFLFSGGIFKAEAASDGGLNISGYATLEVPDKSGEIIDFPSTVQELEKWSSDTEKRSGGKSKGNLRVMHGLTLGGKVTGLKAVKANVKDKDGHDKEVNAVLVDGYVPPTLPDVIKNVQEGILNGFSIGGKYKAKPTYDAIAGANRYTPVPTEISLVDNPCVPGADIVEAIQKAAGEPQKGEVMAKIPTRESIQKTVISGGSYEELSRLILEAISSKYNFDEDAYPCVVATYADKVVIRLWDNGVDQYYLIPYESKDNAISVGAMEPIEHIDQYVSADALKALNDQFSKAAKEQKEQSDNDKLHTAAESRAKKYGISFKEKGSLTPPAGKPTNETDYGDPVNYSFPIDSDHIKPAVSYFNQSGQREDGGYSSEEWAIIGGRIAAAANRLEGDGKKYSYKDGKIDIETKEAKKLTKEEIQKAAEAAGLSPEDIAKLMKAAEGEDGGKEDAKDGDGKDGAAAGEKDGEKDDAAKAAESDLQKAGKTISDQTGKHLEAMHKAALDSAGKCMKAAAFIGKCKKALMDGSPLPDSELVVDTSSIDDAGGNTGMEAPEVFSKTVSDELHKAFMPELQKAVSKALESFDLHGLKEQITDLAKTVQAIADTPPQAGPISAHRFDISALQKADNLGAQSDIISSFIKSIEDPNARDKAGQALALQMAKNARK